MAMRSLDSDPTGPRKVTHRIAATSERFVLRELLVCLSPRAIPNPSQNVHRGCLSHVVSRVLEVVLELVYLCSL